MSAGDRAQLQREKYPYLNDLEGWSQVLIGKQTFINLIMAYTHGPLSFRTSPQSNAPYRGL